MSSPAERLAELGYPLDEVPPPGAVYRQVSVIDRLVYVSGATPMRGPDVVSVGKVPSQVSAEDASEAAALCAANCLRFAHKHIGLDKIERVIRLHGYVNSDADFTDQHIVINGASNLLLKVFGDDKGLAARTALGMAQLPLGSSTEVEMILELKA